MPLRLLKLASRAKDVPEVRVVLRVIVGIVGAYVLVPVAVSLLDPSQLTAIDYVGLVVIAAVGLGLLRLAIRGPSSD